LVNELGSAYHPVGTYAGTFRADRHDAASGYRQFDFVDGCGCFRYTSGLQST
jgi:hypothetical protein